jgi:GNAT superfamily N-acetyltransferase
MSDVILRFVEATPQDAQILARISERAFHSDVHYGSPGKGGPPGYDSDRGQMRLMMAGEYYKILRYEQIVGGVVVQMRGYQYYEVLRIFVDPLFQNQGIGAQTFEFLWQAHPQVKKWTLGTPGWNTRTPHFYRKVGFVEMGRDGRGGILFERHTPES